MPENENTEINVNENYIETIENLKKSTVPRADYNKIMDDNRKLVEALATSKPTSPDVEVPVIPSQAEIDELRKKLFKPNSGMSDLEFIKTTLSLRDALIANGEPDPFMPTNKDYIDDDYSKERREYIANGLKEIVDYCADDDKLFQSEKLRCIR